MYTIANLYAPVRSMKQEQLDIFSFLQNSIQHFKLENTIKGGEFNLYLNPRLDKLDTMPDSHDNPVYWENILSFLQTENFTDIWRTLNPYVHIFTSLFTRSRLDYFFTSDHLLNTIKNVEILLGFDSDHSLICISFLNDTKENVGKGFWKFNSSLLHDSEYVNSIKQLLAESTEKVKHIEDKIITCELIKLEIRNIIVLYYINKKRVFKTGKIVK